MTSCKDNDFDSLLIQSLILLNPTKTFFDPHQPQKHPTTAAENDTAQRPRILQEEARIEREIVQAIASGKTESLKPNSGEAISIGEHYVCVSFHEETESDCRAWEWHGHVVSYSKESGYTQEYVYGSYFERVTKRVVYEETEEERERDQESGFVLREFIGGLNLMDGRVFYRNFSDSSRRV